MIVTDIPKMSTESDFFIDFLEVVRESKPRGFYKIAARHALKFYRGDFNAAGLVAELSASSIVEELLEAAIELYNSKVSKFKVLYVDLENVKQKSGFCKIIAMGLQFLVEEVEYSFLKQLGKEVTDAAEQFSIERGKQKFSQIIASSPKLKR